MNERPQCIVGAGLSGLIAAHAWPRAALFDRAPAAAPQHRALLRFRSDDVSALVGIPFRRVRVRKSVWFNHAHQCADIRTANMYSTKVLGAPIGDRSIWNTEAADRFIAPESLYEQLVEAVGSRITWNHGVEFTKLKSRRRSYISTAPLPHTLGQLGIDAPAGVAFDRAAISVFRYRVPRADVFQTVYFPTDRHSVYRASITGDLLIIEHAGDGEAGDWFEDVLMAFGLDHADHIDNGTQQFGKIVDIDADARKRLLYKLTAEHGIYSLGRFATWRNILLDDVVRDIAVIKQLIKYDSPYDHRRSLFA